MPISPDVWSRLSGCVSELESEIREINAANGWDLTEEKHWSGEDKHKIPAVIALIHSEVSEALEAYRKGDRENFFEELGDAVIRILDVTGGFPESIVSSIREKLDVNRGRGHRHGGKRV